VLLGSTNWTDTGLCGQSNNALVVNDAAIAQAYRDYWDRLKADTDAVTKRDAQGPTLRTAGQTPGVDNFAIDGASASMWFSPNTPAARKSPTDPHEAVPVDLQQVFALMAQAQKTILFLVFQPGHPSIVTKAGEVADTKPDLFIRGAATDPGAVSEFNTQLIHRTPSDARVGRAGDGRQRRHLVLGN